MLLDLTTDLLVALAYAVVGVALMAVGYLLVDMGTPGRLDRLIWADGNRNAALLLTSNLVGVGIIVVSAIAASPDDVVVGIIGTAAYGLLGLALMAVAFMLLDAVTPGRLREILVSPEPHPATWVTGVIHVATGAIVAAAMVS